MHLVVEVVYDMPYELMASQGDFPLFRAFSMLSGSNIPLRPESDQELVDE